MYTVSEEELPFAIFDALAYKKSGMLFGMKATPELITNLLDFAVAVDGVKVLADAPSHNILVCPLRGAATLVVNPPSLLIVLPEVDQTFDNIIKQVCGLGSVVVRLV